MRYLLLFFVYLYCGTAFAQEQGTLPQRPISEDAWARATQDIDFSQDKEKPKEEAEQQDETAKAQRSPNRPSNFNFTGLGTFVQVLCICLGAFLLGWAIFYFLKQPYDRKIKEQNTITIENLEEHLEESDLDRFLRESLAAGRFNDAIRIHFLQLMKGLNEKGHIKWAKEKTNRDYLHELQASPFHKDIRKQTRIYEKIWYGNLSIDQSLYDVLAPDFKGLLKRI